MSAAALAVLVPYRERSAHLRIFVPHLGRHLQRQGIPYRLWVLEQAADRSFNRGKLLNVGYRLARPEADYVALHDVDMICYRAVDYRAAARPIHLAGAASQYGYRLPYPTYFGGVTLFNCDDFARVNGFANEYWGWGSEDDDLLLRVQQNGLDVERRPGRFESLWHPPYTGGQESTGNFARFQEAASGRSDWRADGLCNLSFSLLARETRSVGRHEYQHVLVEL
jgi:beta-1,4-galactosyltransferase 1